MVVFPRKGRDIRFMKKRVFWWLSGAMALVVAGCGSGVLWKFPVREKSKAAKQLSRMLETTEAIKENHSEKIHYLSAAPENPKGSFLFVHGTPGELDNWGGYFDDPQLKE